MLRLARSGAQSLPALAADPGGSTGALTTDERERLRGPWREHHALE